MMSLLRKLAAPTLGVGCRRQGIGVAACFSWLMSLADLRGSSHAGHWCGYLLRGIGYDLVKEINKDAKASPPTPPPPSPPPSDEEPSAETYDPAAELVGDPDEPYVVERVLHGAPEAYYSDTSYGSERESASTDTTPSSHCSSGSVSLGYGSASSGSASDGASDDDLVNRYFAGTFPPP
ncbi:hypothetical protein PIB30_042039 [Stylosanthes scabra]|uniref:Uncharacterized protein n=1 Tax=Stylosanthes scabra TaxID=79078 RepID=A0ABU6WF34_9FABA|nr:hypothetical protein [Stylosanthes scabra]